MDIALLVAERYAKNGGHNLNDHYDRAAAISWMRDALKAAWQPIETAPRDGSSILIWVGGGVKISSWYIHYMGGKPDRYRKPEWYSHHMGEWSPLDPTHWQPLPPPPEDTP